MQNTTKNNEPLNISILTISDTRTLDNDTSGNYLSEVIQKAGHNVCDRAIVKDDIYQQRYAISKWLADSQTNVIISTGGTGFHSRDNTLTAVQSLCDREIEGFGELFRAISYKEIGSSTIQSSAFAGRANNKLIFCLPGSKHACQTAWNNILVEQLNENFKPCNFINFLKQRK